MANEKRLIDAVELLRDAEEYGPIRGGLADMYDVKWLVDAQITVDAVEVVRCKDCEMLCPCGNDNYICSSWGSWTDLEGWCCKGERKNDG